MPQTFNGTVKYFNARKKKGVITDGTGEDVPFKQSQLRPAGKKTIDKNADVTFQAAYTFDGDLFAINVVKVGNDKDEFSEESLDEGYGGGVASFNYSPGQKVEAYWLDARDGRYNGWYPATVVRTIGQTHCEVVFDQYPSWGQYTADSSKLRPIGPIYSPGMPVKACWIDNVAPHMNGWYDATVVRVMGNTHCTVVFDQYPHWGEYTASMANLRMR